MAGTQRRNQQRAIFAVVLAVVGMAAGISMGMKAHDFYGSNRFQFDLEAPQCSFELQPGRYELTYKKELGPLTFEIVSTTGQSVEVKEFGWVTQLFHTQGWRGHAFVVDRPGKIQLTVKPWPGNVSDGRVNLSSTNTEAIARWTGGGILLSGLSCGVAMMILLPGLRRKTTATELSTTATTARP